MKRLPIGVALFFFALGGLFGCGEKIEPGTTSSASGPMMKAVVAEARISDQPLDLRGRRNSSGPNGQHPEQ